MKLLPALLLVLSIAACGGKSTPAGGGGGGTGPEEPMPGPLTAGQWEGMDHEARAHFMGKVVLPTMKAEFQAFDGERFTDFDCATCHGPGAADKTFEMPNPDLMPLDGDTIMNPDEDHLAITQFMGAKVKPMVANLLGRPEWSEATPDGFGCFACHPMKQ